MVNFNRGEPERIDYDVETDDMSPEQRKAAVKNALDEFEQEVTNVRYSNDKSIKDEYEDVLDAYTGRVVDLFE